MALTFLGIPPLSCACLLSWLFIEVCAVQFNMVLAAGFTETKSYLTPNSSWGSPGKFWVKSSPYRVALSPFLHRVRLGPFCIDFGISRPTGVVLWHFREDGGGLPSVCSNKGK